MIVNRSAPPGPVVPRLIYHDVAKAIDWLSQAFGFSERLRTPPDQNGIIHHAQLAAGAGAVMLTGDRAASPGQTSASPGQQFLQGLYVQVDDVNRHFERAKQFGARILAPPKDCEFGERQYSAEDFAGHRWTFSQSVADVSPQEWGARVAKLAGGEELLPRPRLCYLEIPAVDAHRSAAFYERVFGWNIRHRNTARPSFDDATGYVSGAWVTGRHICRERSLLPYIGVDSLQATLALVTAHGGEIVEEAHPDEPGNTSRIALFHDPAGNTIGLYQQG